MIGEAVGRIRHNQRRLSHARISDQHAMYSVGAAGGRVDVVGTSITVHHPVVVIIVDVHTPGSQAAPAINSTVFITF